MFESKCMNNEVTIEEYDKNLRATTKMASDNEQKLDELTRKLGVQEKTYSQWQILGSKGSFTFLKTKDPLN